MAKPPASGAERVALGIAVAAATGFGIYGFISGAPSTVGYLVGIVLLTTLVAWFRMEQLPGSVAIGLAIDGAAVLAGGLVQVGNDVLFNASIGPRSTALHTHILQFDHLVHSYGSFIGTLALWALLAPTATESARRNLIVMCLLAGIGLGGINEMIEFLATIAHSGAHVGGYNNTGWDLVANTIGATTAALVIRLLAPSRAPE